MNKKLDMKGKSYIVVEAIFKNPDLISTLTYNAVCDISNSNPRVVIGDYSSLLKATELDHINLYALTYTAEIQYANNSVPDLQLYPNDITKHLLSINIKGDPYLQLDLMPFVMNFYEDKISKDSITTFNSDIQRGILYINSTDTGCFKCYYTKSNECIIVFDYKDDLDSFKNIIYNQFNETVLTGIGLSDGFSDNIKIDTVTLSTVANNSGVAVITYSKSI